MSSHLEYYSSPSAGGGMLPAGGGVMQGMEDSMQLSIQAPGRPLSVCSVSSCSAGGPTPAHRSGNGLYSNCNGTNPQEIMDDELLMSLSVRELNKRLHGCPREQVNKIFYFPFTPKDTPGLIEHHSSISYYNEVYIKCKSLYYIDICI